MPPYHLAPSESQTQADLLRRVDALEFKLRKFPEMLDQRWPPLTFSYPGFPAPGAASPRWYTNDMVGFTTARLSAATAGSGDLSVDVNHNGSLVLTLTIGSAVNTALFAAAFSLAPGDWVDVECTAADGQENVSVELYQ